MVRKGKLLKRVLSRYGNKSQNRRGSQLYSPLKKSYDCIWIFKIGNADDTQSVPHAHVKDVGHRLDTWTGDLYPAGN